MKVKDVMTGTLVTVNTDTTIQSAAEMMKDNDIGAIPVKKDGRLEGFITDRDIVIRALAQGLSPDTPVGEVMSTGLVTCYEDDDINVVAKDMKDRRIRRVVVLDRDENPVGVVSLGDLAAHGQMKLASETLQKVSEPVHSK